MKYIWYNDFLNKIVLSNIKGNDGDEFHAYGEKGFYIYIGEI